MLAGRSPRLRRKPPPDKLALIQAWRSYFHEMIPGAIGGCVEILRDLRDRNIPIYALTNWSAETFEPQPARFDFLAWFDGIVVSGREKLIKPDPRIFRLLLDRYGLDAAETVFIDDVQTNVAAAAELGIHGIHFTSPEDLRRDLSALSLL